MKRILLVVLLLLLILPESRGEDAEPDREFNIGFYYDAQAAQKVQYLGGMEMHARLCASQFNQALMSAGIDKVWVYAVMADQLDYDAKGDMEQALMHLSGDKESRLLEDMRRYELDFIVGVICRESQYSTQGMAYSFDYREGVFEAQEDHEAEWRRYMGRDDATEDVSEELHVEIIQSPASESEGEVHLQYAYRVLIVDLHSALNDYTFIHELGHLFGAGHSRDQYKSRGPANEDVTPYASGAYTSIESEGKKYYYATAMSYNAYTQTDDEMDYVQLPMFSAPVYQSVGTHGDIVLGDEDNDNARAICETAAILADHRPYLFTHRNTRLDATRKEYLRLIGIMCVACLIVIGGVIAIVVMSFYIKAQDSNNHKRKATRHDRIM